jgi:hypothetical protein
LVRSAGIAHIARRHGDVVSSTSSPVVVVLAAVLLGLVWLTQSDLHLLAAGRLGELIGPSPLPGLSRHQVGKVAALAGVAMLCGGAVLVALQWPRRAADRPLAKACLLLLALGGILVAIVDIAPAVWPDLVDRELASGAERTLEQLVLGGCTVLVASRLRGPGVSPCCARTSCALQQW